MTYVASIGRTGWGYILEVEEEEEEEEDGEEGWDLWAVGILDTRPVAVSNVHPHPRATTHTSIP